ncbi:MAG: transcription-repair coupling factor [Bacillota bacterium]|nr:transcription-repair coupling factor [Bacillota bacterium]
MRFLVDLIAAVPALKGLGEPAGRAPVRDHVHGAGGSHQALLGAVLGRRDKPLLVVTPGEKEALQIAENLGHLLPDRGVFLLPSWEILPVQVLAYSRHIIVPRLRALEALSRGLNPVVVAPVEGLARRLPPPAALRESVFSLRRGAEADPEDLRLRLVTLGYEAVARVEGEGQFASRGGILDVFPSTAAQPVRLEFWGDEIVSMRLFDPETQRSESEVEEVPVAPLHEVVVLDHGRWESARRALEQDGAALLKKLKGAGREQDAAYLGEHLPEVLARMEQRQYFPGIEEFLDYFYPEAVSFFAYLPPGTMALVAEPDRMAEVGQRFEQQRVQGYGSLLEQGRALPRQYRAYLSWPEIMQGITALPLVYATFLPRVAAFPPPGRTFHFLVKGLPGTLGRADALVGDIQSWRHRGYAVGLLAGSAERAKKLVTALRRSGVDAFESADLSELVPGNVAVNAGKLSQGFEVPDARLAVFTEPEIYGKRLYDRQKPYRKETRTLAELDLNPGDYVVHVNHGIGRYLGITLLEIGGVKREYLQVKYAGEDKLYVPTDQLGMVQKYIGAEGEVPRLSRLGGTDWARAKRRVREAVREMAQDLVNLYAARQSLAGFAFPSDTPWQAEFEQAFPYQETPDQIRAIAEIKKDMERPRPMDRLLCGDVGYGKTEVAMRAAFKAVTAGKQVAVLVPTTVLAQQHYNTFRERFAGYPVKIDVLSRFRSPREQREVLTGLSRGSIDIVIGTHRLVQDDVTFKDLGLVVVDEEQRFGVLHKERLKILYPRVDVLTLTATPIPRTLYMSLIGIRDTSVLETPPRDRFPVQTYVLEEDPVIIREAVVRELGRGGQVYFVHNRVMELDRVAGWVQDLVPEARVAMAHGQMREDDLEQVMVDFNNGEYDILVCTTIIESGLDIPNVNTLIVKDSDQLGLAQLYQLRGRVGRSNRLAYAYLTFRRERILAEAAEKRLAAVRDFTDFGSGYRLAKRDLEIRGAGNLLGTEQHGHISVVGFEMYCRLLEEAVRELKGEAAPPEVETVVELPVTAFLPDDYVPDAEEKVRLYHILAGVKDPSAVDDLAAELQDRFGRPPAPVANLLAVARIRARARRLGIKAVNRQDWFLRFVLAPEHALTGERLVAATREYPGRLRFKEDEDQFEIRLRVPPRLEPEGVLREVEGFFECLEKNE